MKFHTIFFSKIRKDVANSSSAAVMIGTLTFNICFRCSKELIEMVLLNTHNIRAKQEIAITITEFSI